MKIEFIDSLSATPPPAKRPKLTESPKLLETPGVDFLFSDRTPSLEILADSLENRYKAWCEGKIDRNLHPLPFLADGPGTGKTRFLLELSKTFKDFVMKNTDRYRGISSIMNNTVFVNISFGNGTKYDKAETDILNSVCLRIHMSLFDSDNETAAKEVNKFFVNEFHDLKSFLKAFVVAPSQTCVILGIDEINYVFSQNEDEFRRIFNLIGSLSCACKPFFFVGIFAGTVIGPMSSVVSGSSHPPLHIPLPLLSYDSCLKILSAKNAKLASRLADDKHLRVIVGDMGGHCRALEVLYKSLVPFCELDVRLVHETIVDEVRRTLLGRYGDSLSIFNEEVIVNYFLRTIVDVHDFIFGKKTTWQELETLGGIKLVEAGVGARKGTIVNIPPIFIRVFLWKSSEKQPFKFWRDIILGEKLLWQTWEVFNVYYFAFRLSLFSAVNRSRISLDEFFSGAILRVDESIELIIPSSVQVKVKELERQFPAAGENESFDCGTVLKNKDGAPFDAFTYLECQHGKRILLAFQMKFSYTDSKYPQKISNRMIDKEYSKTQDAIQSLIPGTDFVFVLTGRCDSNFDEKKLPMNCVIVGNERRRDFYGDFFLQRITDC